MDKIADKVDSYYYWGNIFTYAGTIGIILTILMSIIVGDYIRENCSNIIITLSTIYVTITALTSFISFIYGFAYLKTKAITIEIKELLRNVNEHDQWKILANL